MTPKVVNPDMLILARESRGKTQDQLAEEVGLSQAEVSRYESGARTVGEDHLERIADILGYPPAFFYQAGQRSGTGSSGIYHRKRKTIPSRSLSSLEAKLNILRSVVDRLLRNVDIECPQRFPQYDVVEMKGDVERIAELVRAAWKLPSGPIKDLVGAIENAGGVVHRMDFETRKLDALVMWTPPSPPIFLMNESIPGDRLRFTLAHEIGHLVMHDIPRDEMEAEADGFASAFLMPSRDILPYLDRVNLQRLTQLKPYWRVSIAALIRRAKDLGQINERQYRSLYEQMGRQGYRIEEPVPIPIEQPTLLKEIFDAHLDTLKYSISDLASLLTLHEDELQTTYMPQRRTLRLIQLPKPKISRSGHGSETA